MSGIRRTVIVYTVGLATGSVLTVLVMNEGDQLQVWIDSPELVEHKEMQPTLDSEALYELNLKPEEEGESIGVHMDPDAPGTWPRYQGDQQPANLGDQVDPNFYFVSRIPDDGGEVGGWIGTPEEEVWAWSSGYPNVEIGEFEPVDDSALGDGTD